VAPPANPWSDDLASPIPRARVSESTSRIAPPTPNAVAPAPAAVVKGLRPSMHTYAVPVHGAPVVSTSAVTSNSPTVAFEIFSRSTVPFQLSPSCAMTTEPTWTPPPATCTVYERSVTRSSAVPATGTFVPDCRGTALPGASCPLVTSTLSMDAVQGPSIVATAWEGNSDSHATARAADRPSSAKTRLMTALR
jgi:hypothetical protein